MVYIFVQIFLDFLIIVFIFLIFLFLFPPPPILREPEDTEREIKTIWPNICCRKKLPVTESNFLSEEDNSVPFLHSLREKKSLKMLCKMYGLFMHEVVVYLVLLLFVASFLYVFIINEI